MERLSFIPEGETEAVEFLILEETTLAGVHYLLVTDEDPDSDEAEGSAYVLKDTAPADAAESVYEMVEDEQVLDALFPLFRDALDDMGITLEDETRFE